MKIAHLEQEHPSFERALWRRYDALYRGGAAFRAVIGEFLHQNEVEPHSTYEIRKRESPYRSYVGPIVDFFAAKLLYSTLTLRARSKETGEPVEPDPFYASFKENCDGCGLDLDDFARSQLTKALVKGRAWHRVTLPDDGRGAPVSKADWQSRGLGEARIQPLENEQVIDWEVDDDGEMEWAIVHTVERRRGDPRAGRHLITERWEVYDRADVEIFEVTYDPDKGRPEDAPSIGRRAHGFSRVPLVRLGFVGTRGLRTRVRGQMLALSPSAVEGLWLTNRIADSQVEHFRLAAAMSWNLKRTCYAVACFQIKDKANPPVMGAGYGILLDLEEKATWLAPPTDHLEVLQEQLKDERNELYRVANQMAQGIDNNAAAIGRSGESKAVDASAAEVCLRVYGAIVKEAIEETLNLISSGRGEADVCWSIEGLDTFNLGDLDVVTKGAAQAKLLDIRSPTFWREVHCRIAEMLAPHVDEQTKQAIREEIAAAIEAQAKAEADAAHGADDAKDEDDEPDPKRESDEDEADEHEEGEEPGRAA